MFFRKWEMNTMKKLKFILELVGFSALIMFSSCNNLELSEFKSDVQNSSKKGYTSFVITTGSARFIAADNYDISKVTSWTLSYTDESVEDSEKKSITWTSESEETESSSSYITKENGILKVNKFPVGTYTFELKGTYTENNEHTLYGMKSGVKLVEDSSKNSISIMVGSKKTEKGTGNLSLTFENLKLDSSEVDFSDVAVTLFNISTKENIALVKDTDYTIENAAVTITKNDILSGLYQISFSYPGLKIIIEGGNDFIEVADGLTTTGTGSLICRTEKKYYATNEATSYNGLSALSRKNLTDLFNDISKTKPEESEISIYMEETPEIDIDAINALKKLTDKIISVYKGSKASSSILSVLDSDISISGEIILTSSSENKKLEVTSIAVGMNSPYAITLKNGTSLYNLDENISENFAGTLTINAIDSTGKDNFSAYISNPFIIAKADISKNLLLQEELETQNSYTIVSDYEETEKTYSYSLKPSSISGLNISSSADATISAVFENDSSQTYSSGAEIPYINDTLKFSLTGIENATVVGWYLNQNLFENDSFNPYTNDILNIDGKNTVTCLFSVDGTNYISQFTFEFSLNAVAVYSSLQSSSQSNKVSFVADYKDTTEQSVDIINEKTLAYCFDENSDLYMICNDENYNPNLYKYSRKVSAGYDIEKKESLMNFAETITTEIKDISYDVNSNYFYILATDGNTASAHAFSTTGNNIVHTVEIPTTIENNSYSLNQIAVYANDVYVADESNILKMSFTVSGETGNPEVFYSVSGDFTSGSPKITDLQIGDGCGNHTETLYALVRDVNTIDNTNDNTHTYYSRGGLVGISISDSNSKDIYGYTEAKVGSFTGADGDSSVTCELYAPKEEASTTEFFGPTRFVAVVPKKLVIFDNGFVFADNNGTGKIPVTYKNSFIEFDFKDATLTRCSENENISSDVEEVSFYNTSYFSEN